MKTRGNTSPEEFGEAVIMDGHMQEIPVALIRLPENKGKTGAEEKGAVRFHIAAKRNPGRNRRCMKQLAARGNTQAMCAMAELLLQEKDPRSLRKAIRYYTAAAEKGHAESMLALGCLFLENEAVYDPEQALFLLVKAGELLPTDQVEQIADCLQRHFYCGNAREETETERPSAENEHTISPNSGG